MSQESIVTLLVGLLLIAALVGRSIGRKNRGKRLSRVAAGMGLAMGQGSPLVDLEGLSRKFTLFDHLVKRSANLIEGQVRGFWLMEFDYLPTAGKDNDQYSVALIALPVALPGFQLRPTKAADKLWDKLGYEDINISEDQVFSQSFRLMGGEPEQIGRLFNEELCEYLTAKLESGAKWAIEASATQLLYSTKGLVSEREMAGFINDAVVLAEQFTAAAAEALTRILVGSRGEEI